MLFVIKCSLEHILPDSLFASPTKSASEHQSLFASFAEPDDSFARTTNLAASNNVSVLPSTSNLNMASLNSCYFEMPRYIFDLLTVELCYILNCYLPNFLFGQEAIEM